MLSNQQKLHKAIKSVRGVLSMIEWIYETNRHIIDGNEVLSKDFSEFKRIAEETISKLENPVLSIAMVGTTSAGKSTLVNAFIGRRIAPVEAKEMSAGLLHMTHSDKSSLKVYMTKDAKWKTGAYDGLSNEEIYSKIKEIFDAYHRFGSKIAAPHIGVSGPIEWQTNASILDLPENLRVEFIDLPGLKTIQDPKNLSLIQKMLSKALCIVAMDFNDVDQSRIQRLLDEVKDIVKSLNNNTDFLLFLLNKVDSAKAGQINVNEKIQELQTLIKQTLDLKEERQILPFVGHLLYLAQLGVVKDPTTGKISGYRPEYLSNIFEDIANIFVQKYKTEEISKTEFALSEKIKNALLFKEPLDINDVETFYNLCVRMAYADGLYKELSKRLRESFTYIVIRPSMDDYSKYLTKLLADIQTYINISRNNSVLDLLSEKIGLLKSRLYLLGAFEQENYEFAIKTIDSISATLVAVKGLLKDEDVDNIILASCIEKDLNKLQSLVERREKGYIFAQIEDIHSSIDFIATKLSQLRTESEIIAFLNTQKSNRAFVIFNGMSDVPREICKALTSSYLDEFRVMIANKESKGSFIEKMSKKMATSLATEFGKPYGTLYDLFYSHFAGFVKLSECYYLKTSVEKTDWWKSVADNDFDNANLHIRDVLSKLANMEFQKETHTMTGSIKEYLHMELENILQEIRMNVSIPDADISELIKNTLAIAETPIELPEELFVFSTPKGIIDKGKEKIGTKTEVVDGVCCDDYVTVDVYGDYYKYSYPNEVSLYNRWKSGIDAATTKFWKIINNWLKEQVSIYMKQIESATLQVAEHVDNCLDARVSEIQAKKNSDLAQLDKISKKLVEIKAEANNALKE